MQEIQLIVTNGTDTAILDLYENDNVSLNDSYSNITTFDVTGGYSQTFRVPMSETNSNFFGLLGDPNYTGFDFKKKTDATLSVNTLPIAQGHIQVKKVYELPSGFFEAEIVFFSTTPNLATIIGDKKIADLTQLPTLNHEMTFDNAVTPPAYTNWMLTERGQKWSEQGEAGTRPIQSTVAPVYVGDLTPAVNGWWLFDQVFKDAGYSYTSTFIEDQLSKYWLLFCNNRYILTTEGTNTKFYLDYEDGLDLLNLDASIKVCNDLTEFFDNGGNVDASSVFTAPFTGQYNFRVFLKARIDQSITNTLGYETIVTRFVDSFGVQQHINYFNIQEGDPGQWFVDSMNFSLNMSEGDTLQLQLQRQGLMTDPLVNFHFDRGTGWELISTSEPVQGGTVDFVRNAPDYKQIDFVRDILKMHNLVFVPSKINPKNIQIETFNDFIGSGGTDDWTGKLDKSKDVVIYPTTDDQQRKLMFTYSAGGEYLSELYVKQGNRIYGDYRIDNTQNDFATSENTIGLTLCSTPCNEIPGTSVPVPKFIDVQGEFITPMARLMFNGGVAQVALFDDVSTGVLANVAVPSHFTTLNATFADEDLNFAPEALVQNITSIPFNTLYNNYWRRYYNELYSDQSRIMEAYFNLTVADFNALDYSKQIWIRDSYWRVLEVSDFVPAVSQTTKLKLAKIVSSVQDCTYTPQSVAINGIVTFVDGAGTTSDGSQLCCERYGYNWDETTGKCRAFSNPREAVNGGTGTQVTDFSVPGLGRKAISIGQNASLYHTGITIAKSAAIDGASQGGIVILSGTGDYLSSGDGIVITDDGRDLMTPERSSVGAMLQVSVTQFANVSGVDMIVKSHVGLFSLKLDKRTTSSSASVSTLYEAGDFGTLSVNVNTGTAQKHIIKVVSSGLLPLAYPILGCKVTATLIYSQVRQ